MSRRSLISFFFRRPALSRRSAALAALLFLGACGPENSSHSSENQDWGLGDGDGDGSPHGDGDGVQGDSEEPHPCDDPSTNSCHPLATCTAAADSYQCSCGPDFTGDGAACEYIDAPCNVSYVIADRGEADDPFVWDLQVPGDCPTIQEALDAAARTNALGAGAVTVQAGTYLENLDFGGAAVTLRSLEGPELTIIDGSSETASTLSFTSGEGPHSVLEGFTITGGSGTTAGASGYGGGINIHQASPTLRDLILRENALLVDEETTFYGGGISIRNSAASLERIQILNNHANYYGGGIYVAQSDDASLRNLLFAGNEAVYGAGMAIYFSSLVVENALFLDNDASFGAGLMIQGESPRITQATFHANQGDAIYIFSGAPRIGNTTVSDSTGHGIRNEEGAPDVRYSNFWNNASGVVLGMESPSAQMHNLFSDPLFQNVSSFEWQAWDLTLQGSSPLIGAGDPGEENADGSPADIGAYGGPHGSNW